MEIVPACELFWLNYKDKQENGNSTSLWTILLFFCNSNNSQLKIFIKYLVKYFKFDTGLKLNVRKAFRRRPKWFRGFKSLLIQASENKKALLTFKHLWKTSLSISDRVLSHFMLLVSFYTPWKLKKLKVF